jgi:hypothetical protein
MARQIRVVEPLEAALIPYVAPFAFKGVHDASGAVTAAAQVAQVAHVTKVHVAIGSKARMTITCISVFMVLPFLEPARPR